jgi:hypothetical protein
LGNADDSALTDATAMFTMWNCHESFMTHRTQFWGDGSEIFFAALSERDGSGAFWGARPEQYEKP